MCSKLSTTRVGSKAFKGKHRTGGRVHFNLSINYSSKFSLCTLTECTYYTYIDKYKCILFKTEAPLTLTTMFNSSQMIIISQKLRPYQRLFYRPNIKSTEWIICFKIDRAIRNRWQNDPAAHRMMMRFGLRTILRDPFGWRKDIWNLGEEADDIRLRNYCSK